MIYFIDKINGLFDYFCNDPPVFDSNIFPWTSNFRNNWQIIHDEYISYTSDYPDIPIYKNINEYTSQCNIEGQWKSIFLRIFGVDTNIANYFPNTMKLINISPCTLAFFSVFEPYTKLCRHRGVYKGVIRYHLPIIIPNEWDKCFINVNGRVLNWRIGQDLVFDDRFIHHAENNTSQRRVVLFLDIKRDFNNIFLNILNTILLRFIKSNDILLNTINNVNNLVLTLG